MGKGHQLHAKFACTSKIIFSIPTIIFQSQIGTPISNSYIMSMRAVWNFKGEGNNVARGGVV